MNYITEKYEKFANKIYKFKTQDDSMYLTIIGFYSLISMATKVKRDEDGSSVYYYRTSSMSNFYKILKRLSCCKDDSEKVWLVLEITNAAKIAAIYADELDNPVVAEHSLELQETRAINALRYDGWILEEIV